MKIKSFDGKAERQILISMIMDGKVLGRIIQIWQEPGMFKSAWANTLGSLCVEFYRTYSKAPAADFRLLLDNWLDEHQKHAEVEIVEDFAIRLNEELECEDELPASDLIIDLAGKYFLEVSLGKMAVDIRRELERRDVDSALAVVKSFTDIQFGDLNWIDPFNDKDAVARALADQFEESMISYPGDIGRFLNSQLTRDAFVSFMGPDKRGKSFWLLDAVYRAAMERRKIAYFVIGDMSEQQVMRRLLARVARQPFKKIDVKIPIGFEIVNDEMVVTHEERSYPGLDLNSASKALDKVVKHRIRSREPYLKLSIQQADSVTVTDLRAMIKQWHDDSESGWFPDVIVIDYADNLAPINQRADFRQQIDKTWANLRALSQEFHCLVLTATQSDSAAYTANLLRRSNFSDSKKKNAHITAMIGINVTGAEKKMGLTRLNLIQARDSEFSEENVVFCANCFALANPVVRSTFWMKNEDQTESD